MLVEGFACVACDWTAALLSWKYTCPVCNNNLELVYSRKAVLAEIDRGGFPAADDPTLWRYRCMLPAGAEHRSGLNVGWTPLYDCGRQGGISLFLKDDTHNPSASLKDRASEIVVAYARAHASGPIVAASTGNAAASLACIAARSGWPVVILVPQSIPLPKLAQLLAFGARVVKVAGGYDDAYDLARRLAAERGWFCRNTGYNPLTREGKKTCAFELWEQLGRQVPDWVIVPTGDGNIIASIWKGFCELRLYGLTDRLPRIAAVQARGSAAITTAWQGARTTGTIELPTVCSSTVADSISVNLPRDGYAAVKAVLESGGVAMALSDASISDGVKRLARSWGIFAEPAGAASFAALDALRAQGTVVTGQSVVCLVTGSGLKDTAALLHNVDADRVPVVSGSDWEAAARAVEAETPMA